LSVRTLFKALFKVINDELLTTFYQNKYQNEYYIPCCDDLMKRNKKQNILVAQV
jgi:hypothetical protein